MKVIKVIVDEIVNECAFCDFLYRVDYRWWVANADENGRVRYLCTASGFKRTFFNIEGYARPDWCPLVTVDQALRDCASPFAECGESEE
jgi:hypothetical protein